MKTIKITAVMLISICLLSLNQAFGQDPDNISLKQDIRYNPNTASYDSGPVQPIINKNIDLETLDFSCNCLTDFWTVSAEGKIQLWSLNDDTITGGSTVVSGASEGLAYCGNPNDLTFYSGKGDVGILYYDAMTSWTEIPIPFSLNNNGGYLHDQYYQGIGNTNPYCRILYYLEGNEVIMIDSLSDKVYAVADIAVDSLGQAWTFAGTGSNSNWIYVYDKTGLINTYDLFFNAYNAYGLTFINDVLYIGFGPNNNVYHGALVPVYIDNSTASLGDPIAFPYSFYDLAECNCISGTAGIGTEVSGGSVINTFPNPVDNQLTINSKDRMERIRLMDLSGKVVVDKQLNSLNHTINTSVMQNGIYILEVFANNTMSRRKILVRH